LGKLDLMQESLAFVAGYGIKCYLICQDINQLHQHYGQEESVTSNCHIQCAFAPNRLETAEHLSRLTGETTVITEEVSRAGRGLSVTVTRSMKPHARRLLTPDECIRLPGPLKDGDRITEAGDMIVYAAGCPAIRGRQPLYFQDPVFQARAAVPPPEKSDALVAEQAPAPRPGDQKTDAQAPGTAGAKEEDSDVEGLEVEACR
jgi:type IV secretion system protein VirD4